MIHTKGYRGRETTQIAGTIFLTHGSAFCWKASWEELAEDEDERSRTKGVKIP
jgi:hypothetical protein